MSQVEYIDSDRMGCLIFVNLFLDKIKPKPREKQKQYSYCVENCGSSAPTSGKHHSQEKHEHPNHKARIAKPKFRNNLRKRLAEDPIESVNKIYR
jgi:hypothetical protein